MSKRPKNKALFYGRRSGRRQELSLPMQLDWAIGEAAQLKLKFDATKADLQHMQEHRLHSHKSIRLDTSSGSDLQRRGFLALIDDALADKGVSHVLIHKRDRFARPQEAVEMVQVEKRLSHAGVTLIFSDGVANPYHPGQGGLERDIMTLLAYSESGNYLNQLAERVILAHMPLARNNFSTGGTPPFGHVRALFDPTGNFVEYLPKGRTVRQEGYHVRWVPGDDEENKAKIRTWIYLLDLKHQGWGGKRIANHLNELEIPSPGAGTIRTDQGVKHVVSGKWGHTTVIDLSKNTTILGIKQYGRRAEGKHRRLGEGGWRLLEDHDLGESGKPKFMNNDPSVIVEGRGESPELYDEEKWREIQAETKRRSRDQAGVSRSSDPAKYPLSCKVVDMTDGCGSTMYGVQQSKRLLYKCGRYMRTAGDECGNNSVDAEALLRFVMSVITQRIGQLGKRSELRAKLLELAVQEKRPSNSTDREAELLPLQLRELNVELDAVRHNMARERDDLLYAALRAEYIDVTERIAEIEQRLNNSRQRRESSGVDDAEKEVAAALNLLDDLGRLTTDGTARVEIGEMLDRLGCRVGLTFVEAIKGKVRRVRKLAGGIVVFGDGELPVPLHGKNRIDGQGPTKSRTREEILGRDKRKSAGESNKMPAPADAQPGNRHREGVSLTKVSREFSRPVELFLAGVAGWEPHIVQLVLAA